MKKFLFLILSLFPLVPLKAQEKTIRLKGSPIVRLFVNYHAGLASANRYSGFELDRSYLGYAFRVNEKLSGQLIFDVGPTHAKEAELERVAYVKNAFLSWKPGNFTLNFGLVKTDQFSVQESFWGYRYILKSFNDEYKFGPSADMGIILGYRFTDWLNADLSVTNGEGYKKINQDNNYRYGLGFTLRPAKSLILRAYYDLYNSDETGSDNQTSLALFAGYTHTAFSIGIEYNKLWNTDFQPGHDQYGYSCYASVDIFPRFTLFSRYDYLTSNRKWKGENNGQRLLTGIQYSPLTYLRIAPNYTSWNPSSGKIQPYLYLNLEFKL